MRTAISRAMLFILAAAIICGCSRLASGSERRRLEQPETFYVDVQCGDDNGVFDGRFPSQPFRTIQAAVDHVANNIDLAGHSATIQGAPAQVHKKGVVVKGFVGVGAIIIDLAGSYIWVDAGDCVSSEHMTTQPVILQNMRIRAEDVSTFGSGNGIIAQTPVYFGIGEGVVFDYCATTHMSSCSPGATIQILSSYTIIYGAPVHMQAACNGMIVTTGREWIVVTIKNRPMFWTAYAQSFMCGTIFLPKYYAQPGTVAYGPRYMCGMAGQIYTDGCARPDFFPGTHPGYFVGAGNNYQ